jgi:glutathione S-transferase
MKEKKMIKLFQPPPRFNAANPSPFCIKLETLLKMANLPYEIVLEGDPRKGPTGKIPFIESNGKKMGDSGLIQKYLEDEKGADFHQGLSDLERAHTLAYTRLVEEHLYWVLVYSRWIEDENWAIVKPIFFGQLPIPLKWFVPDMARKQVLQGMKGHGIGRHPKETIYQLAADDLAALSAFLGDKDFAFGKKPTALDASMYGLLSSILDGDFDTKVKRSAASHKNLVAFTARMRERYFPDL